MSLLENSDIDAVIREFPSVWNQNSSIPEPQTDLFHDKTLENEDFFEQKGDMWIPRAVLDSVYGVPSKVKLEVIKRDVKLHTLICKFLNQILDEQESCKDHDGDQLQYSSSNNEPTSRKNMYLIEITNSASEDAKRFDQLYEESLPFLVSKLEQVNHDESSKGATSKEHQLLQLDSPDLFSLGFTLDRVTPHDELLGESFLKNHVQMELDSMEKQYIAQDDETPIVYDEQEEQTDEDTSFDQKIEPSSPLEQQVMLWQRILSEAQDTMSLVWDAVLSMISTSESCSIFKQIQDEISNMSKTITERTKAAKKLANVYPSRKRDISRWFDMEFIDPSESIKTILSRKSNLPQVGLGYSDGTQSESVPYKLGDSIIVSSFLVKGQEFGSLVSSTDGTAVPRDWKYSFCKSSRETIGLIPIEILAEPHQEGTVVCVWFPSKVSQLVSEFSFQQLSTVVTLQEKVNEKEFNKNLQVSFLSSKMVIVKYELERRDSVLYSTIDEKVDDIVVDEKMCVREKTKPIDNHPLKINYPDIYKEREEPQSCREPSVFPGESCPVDTIPVVSKVAGKLKRCCEKIDTYSPYSKETYLVGYNHLRRKAWTRLIDVYEQIENNLLQATTRMNQLGTRVNEETLIEMETSINAYIQSSKAVMKDIGYCMNNQNDPQCLNLYQFLNEILSLYDIHEQQHKVIMDLLEKTERGIMITEQQEGFVKKASTRIYNMFSSMLETGKWIGRFVWQNKVNLAFYGILACGTAVPLLSGIVKGMAGPSLVGYSDFVTSLAKSSLVLSNIVCEMLKNPTTNILMERLFFKTFLGFVNRGYASKIFYWIMTAGSFIPGVSIARDLFMGATGISYDLIQKAISAAQSACGIDWVSTGVLQSGIENTVTAIFTIFRYYFASVFDWIIGGQCGLVVSSLTGFINTSNTAINFWTKAKSVISPDQNSSILYQNVADVRLIVDTNFKGLDTTSDIFTKSLRFMTRFNVAASEHYIFQYLPYFVPITVVSLLVYSYVVASKQKTEPTNTSNPPEPIQDKNKWNFELIN